jgi:hypothetical protein
MKGLIFTVFLEMVEEKYGYTVADEIVNSNQLASGGVYTSVGTYDHMELFKLIESLSNITGKDKNEILKNYGEYAFGVFAGKYSGMLREINNLFDFLESIETYIHVEVLKLYPDAELPKFESERKGDNILILKYFSKRKMGSFAEGLIISSIKHFKAKAELSTAILNNGEETIFTITKES